MHTPSNSTIYAFVLFEYWKLKYLSTLEYSWEHTWDLYDSSTVCEFSGTHIYFYIYVP